MPGLAADLRAPVLLLAMPQVTDPYFHRCVVLLLHHDSEGSFGFVVNRPTEIRVAEILEGMELAWGGEESTMAYLGGPVQPQLGTVLYADQEVGVDLGEDGPQEVAPGLRMSHHVADLEALAVEPPPSFRLVLGYAGWGAGQLVQEILRNDWLTAPLDRALVFSGEPEDTWDRALRSVGVDPETLPAWTASDDIDTSN